MSGTTLVRLDNICMNFNGVNVLDNISLTLESNNIITLIGPNGAGKSTLVKCILGLQKPSSGRIIKNPSIKIGYVPQKLKINENLPLTVARFLKLSPKISQLEITQALDLVGTSHLYHANMHTLSGGELQRVLLANALLKKPNLLVLDEPVQGVDVNGQLELYNLIVDLKEKLKCAVLMVSHDLHLVMAKTDEVICLHHHICCQGTPKTISEHPEYLSRFGTQVNEMLALYQHSHNHEHNLSGAPIKPCSH